jgi:hypothetical protein
MPRISTSIGKFGSMESTRVRPPPASAISMVLRPTKVPTSRTVRGASVRIARTRSATSVAGSVHWPMISCGNPSSA